MRFVTPSATILVSCCLLLCLTGCSEKTQEKIHDVPVTDKERQQGTSRAFINADTDAVMFPISMDLPHKKLEEITNAYCMEKVKAVPEGVAITAVGPGLILVRCDFGTRTLDFFASKFYKKDGSEYWAVDRSSNLKHLMPHLVMRNREESFQSVAKDEVDSQ